MLYSAYSGRGARRHGGGAPGPRDAARRTKPLSRRSAFRAEVAARAGAPFYRRGGRRAPRRHDGVYKSVIAAGVIKVSRIDGPVTAEVRRRAGGPCPRCSRLFHYKKIAAEREVAASIVTAFNSLTPIFSSTALGISSDSVYVEDIRSSRTFSPETATNSSLIPLRCANTLQFRSANVRPAGVTSVPLCFQHTNEDVRRAAPDDAGVITPQELRPNDISPVPLFR
ncbi:hypothetical protein EVAR_44767_1 [Eumeta japonica]|uniref:Uncharacterized protein n=1 Tax=Eumeta variegata TaxID=151549 RepID=A0A4C1Y597_EUMVA|nr:hypothetical protein EVAR_44767_1 [Eumeta japonica]